VVYFGGWNRLANQPQSETSVYRNGAWVQPGPAAVPPPRSEAGMAYLPSLGAVVLFGGSSLHGSSAPFAALDDTWKWNGENWSRVETTTSPPARTRAAMWYDTTLERIVLHGGRGSTGALNDTWAFDGADWEELTPASPPAVAGNIYRIVGAAHDRSRGETIVQYQYHDGQPGFTYVWDGDDFTTASPPNRWRARDPNPGSNYRPTLVDALVYDRARQRLLCLDNFTRKTLYWSGANWEELSDGEPLFALGAETASGYSLVWHAGEERVLKIGGHWHGQRNFWARTDYANTFAWDGAEWSLLGNDVVDMRSRPSGIWHYTRVSISRHAEVRFIKNGSNTPVTWVVAGAVDVAGTINLRGADTGVFGDHFQPAPGGPGGYAGGVVGPPGSGDAPTNGRGPDGGIAGATDDTLHGGFAGSPILQPILGGSGGGASSTFQLGGGGGGGAILVLSSRDITVNGAILARGARGNGAGGGAGGAIRLVGDRILGDGTLEIADGHNDVRRAGRVRLEGYERALESANALLGGRLSGGLPTRTLRLEANAPSLRVESVDAEPVQDPPTGSTGTPDVVFEGAGPVDIVVRATNVPDGTAVTLKIDLGSSVVRLPLDGEPDVVLLGGIASFRADLPAGTGHLQASAVVQVGAAP